MPRALISICAMSSEVTPQITTLQSWLLLSPSPSHQLPPWMVYILLISLLITPAHRSTKIMQRFLSVLFTVVFPLPTTHCRCKYMFVNQWMTVHPYCAFGRAKIKKILWVLLTSLLKSISLLLHREKLLNGEFRKYCVMGRRVFFLIKFAFIFPMGSVVHILMEGISRWSSRDRLVARGNWVKLDILLLCDLSMDT